MSHDVFISHSSLDKLAADAVCHGLEARGIRCWIAPRDQMAGHAYGEQITDAIEASKVMVLVFSDNVNKSQAVLNEINLAAGANVTIVPFRIAAVEYDPELQFYLGRMHWLDAFPQPVDDYIENLAVTIQRNLAPEEEDPPLVRHEAPEPPAEPVAAAVPPEPHPSPPPEEPAPAPVVAAAPPIGTPPPVRANPQPLIIAGAVVAGLVVLLIVVVALVGHGPAPAANTAASPAAANQVAALPGYNNAPPGGAPPAAAAPDAQAGATGGSDTTPVRAADPQAVNYYETVVTPNGPPTQLAGATVINTASLLQDMRQRDTGQANFLIIDARGCSDETTIPTAICLTENNVDGLAEKAPDHATQLIFFCHDGTCPMSFQFASAAINAGYANVIWYRGGINAWIADGLPAVARSAQ